MLRSRDWVGPLGGKRMTDGWEGEECDVESQHVQGCSPFLYQLRTEGLVLMSKY
jgi:hypothetical protein